jgi:hypothetical protein
MIDLFRIGDLYGQTPSQSVLVYANSLNEALAIACSEGMPLQLEPRSGNLNRFN